MLTAGHSYSGVYRCPGQTMASGYHEQFLSEIYGNQYPSKTHAPEVEPKSGISHRKRVPVACERCRKRKIKCSGDQGDGSGCDNCKTAGYDRCQFLRVRSSLIDYHPATSNSRVWHGQGHYHPYARRREVHQVHQNQSYIPQSSASYTGWPHDVDYSDISTTIATTMPWTHGNLVSAYSVYDGDNNNSYTSQPPSYMLPDPEYPTRSGLSYLCPSSRPQQNSLWLESMQSESIPHLNPLVTSSSYPLTPIESNKPYSTLGINPGQHPVSHERSILTRFHDTPPLATALPSIPPQNRETPPLSAVSHRSSNTWNTDSSSHASNASSRTSCGESQELSNVPLTACEDQSTIYAYPAESTSTQLNVAASSLPIASEENSTEQYREERASTPVPSAMLLSTTDVHSLHSHDSRDSVRTASPIHSLYGYGRSSRSARKPHGLIPTRLCTSGYSSSWNKSPAYVRTTSPNSPQASVSNRFQQHHDSASPLDGSITY